MDFWQVFDLKMTKNNVNLGKNSTFKILPLFIRIKVSAVFGRPKLHSLRQRDGHQILAI